jgi:hypothetical protein
LSPERARPLAEWHVDMGPVLWWRFPVDEPPYVGTPLDRGHCLTLTEQRPAPHVDPRGAARRHVSICFVGGWPGYHTHWTPMPPVPLPPDGAQA